MALVTSLFVPTDQARCLQSGGGVGGAHDVDLVASLSVPTDQARGSLSGGAYYLQMDTSQDLSSQPRWSNNRKRKREGNTNYKPKDKIRKVDKLNTMDNEVEENTMETMNMVVEQEDKELDKWTMDVELNSEHNFLTSQMA